MFASMEVYWHSQLIHQKVDSQIFHETYSETRDEWKCLEWKYSIELCAHSSEIFTVKLSWRSTQIDVISAGDVN